MFTLHPGAPPCNSYREDEPGLVMTREANLEHIQYLTALMTMDPNILGTSPLGGQQGEDTTPPPRPFRLWCPCLHRNCTQLRSYTNSSHSSSRCSGVSLVLRHNIVNGLVSASGYYPCETISIPLVALLSYHGHPLNQTLPICWSEIARYHVSYLPSH